MAGDERDDYLNPPRNLAMEGMEGDTFSTASFLGINSSNFRAVDFLSLLDVSASKRDVRLMNPYEMMSDW